MKMKTTNLVDGGGHGHESDSTTAHNTAPGGRRSFQEGASSNSVRSFSRAATTARAAHRSRRRSISWPKINADDEEQIASLFPVLADVATRKKSDESGGGNRVVSDARRYTRGGPTSSDLAASLAHIEAGIDPDDLIDVPDVVGDGSGVAPVASDEGEKTLDASGRSRDSSVMWNRMERRYSLHSSAAGDDTRLLQRRARRQICMRRCVSAALIATIGVLALFGGAAAYLAVMTSEGNRGRTLFYEVGNRDIVFAFLPKKKRWVDGLMQDWLGRGDDNSSHNLLNRTTIPTIKEEARDGADDAGVAAEEDSIVTESKDKVRLQRKAKRVELRQQERREQRRTDRRMGP